MQLSYHTPPLSRKQTRLKGLCIDFENKVVSFCLRFTFCLYQSPLIFSTPAFPSQAEGYVQPIAVAPLPGREADGRHAPNGARYSR